MVPVTYNVRNLLVRKVTTLVTAIGIALVVFVFAASLMLGEGINAAMQTSGRTDTAIVLRSGGDSELASGLDDAVVDLLRGHPQVKDPAAGGVVGEVVGVVMAPHVGDPETVSNVAIRGVPAEGLAFRPELKIVRGRAPKPGTDEAIIGSAIAGRFVGFDVGGHFEIRHNRPLNIVGEFAAAGSTYESEVWGDVSYIRKAMGREGGVSSVRVRLNSAADFDAYRGEVLKDKRFNGNPPKVVREADYFRDQSQDIGKFLRILAYAFAIMFSLAAMLGAAITMNGAVANRSREIGTLRALGFSRFSILVSFLFEAILLAILGGVIGSLCVLVMSFVSFPVMNFQTFSEIVIHFHATTSVFVKALVFSGAMGLIGGIFPAIRASRVSPVEAMRA